MIPSLIASGLSTDSPPGRPRVVSSCSPSSTSGRARRSCALRRALDDAAVTALVALGATTIWAMRGRSEPAQPTNPLHHPRRPGGRRPDGRPGAPRPGHPGVARATGVPRGRGTGGAGVDRRARDDLGTARAVATAGSAYRCRRDSGAILGYLGRLASHRSRVRWRRRAGGGGPPPAAPSVIAKPRQRFPPPKSRASSTRRDLQRSDRCSSSPRRCPIGSVFRSSTPSPLCTWATRPRGRRGSIMSTW